MNILAVVIRQQMVHPDNVYTFTNVFFTFEIFKWFHSTFVKVIPGNHVRIVLLLVH